MPRSPRASNGVGVGGSPRNLTRTLVDTAMSRFAKTETRVAFVTDGGTPAQQKRSEDCTDAANALIEQTKAEAMLRRAALHACVFDLGTIKIIDEPDGPRVEHVPSWEVMFEPTDAHRGRPTIRVQRFVADKDALVADFAAAPEGYESLREQMERQDLVDDIRSSSSVGMTTADHTLTDQHCLVYEMWRLPVGRQKGRHVIVTDNALLLDEVWTDEEFPFVDFGWSAPLFGAYPVSIAAINAANQDELDGVGNRISQILRKMAIPLWVQSGARSEDKVAVAQLRSGSDAVGDVVVSPPGTTLTRQSADNVAGGELFKQQDICWTRGFQMTGINESSAIGSRPAGLNSAPAQREWNEINQDRLSLVALDYQGAHVDAGARLLDSVARIPEYEITVKDTNGQWMRKMTAADLQLDRADYVIQAFPISALPMTPTGRLAAAADLLQMGAIDRETFMEVVQLPDLKSKLDIALESRRATEAIVARMLDKRQMEAPSDKLNLEYAFKYATTKYLQELSRAKPDDEQLTLLNDWGNAVKALLKKAAAEAQAQAKAAAAAAAPPPGLAGMAGTSLAPLPVAPLAPPVTDLALAGSVAGAA